jgi:aldehyde dehydrogenase (NAD+)
VLLDAPSDAPIMREEIFGPVLPVVPWTEREEVLAIVQHNPQPLATYIFSDDSASQRFFRERIAFGGGCINHCLLHFVNPALPFGGVGSSGMGRYHGQRTFDLFSHQKGMVHGSTLIDPALQYPPYTSFKERLLRWVLG